MQMIETRLLQQTRKVLLLLQLGLVSLDTIFGTKILLVTRFMLQLVEPMNILIEIQLQAPLPMGVIGETQTRTVTVPVPSQRII